MMKKKIYLKKNKKKMMMKKKKKSNLNLKKKFKLLKTKETKNLVLMDLLVITVKNLDISQKIALNLDNKEVDNLIPNVTTVKELDI